MLAVNANAMAMTHVTDSSKGTRTVPVVLISRPMVQSCGQED